MPRLRGGLDRVLSATEIWRCVLKFLDEPDAVYRTRRVCRRVRRATDRVLEAQFDIQRFLFPVFGAQARRFQDVQRDTGALICGSWAMSLFLGERMPEMGPLDIVVNTGSYMKLVYFLEFIGFIPTGDVSKRWMQNEIVVAIRTFVREDDECCAVHVICTPESAIATVLRSFLTLTLNFVAWDRALSLYPVATFCDREGLVLDNVDGDRRVVRSYSSARGFQVHEKRLTVAPWNKGPLAPGRRFFGDGRCWVVRLSGSPAEPWLPSPYIGNGFALRPERVSGTVGTLQTCSFYLKFDVVDHPMLVHSYASCESCAWFIIRCFRRLARHCPDGPVAPWVCYFNGSADQFDITDTDSLVPVLTQAWSLGRKLTVGTELLALRFDPEFP